MIIDVRELSSFPDDPQDYDIVYLAPSGTTYVFVSGSGWVEKTFDARLPSEFQMRDPLTRVSYYGRDYQTILDEMQAWLRVKYQDTYQDFLDSDMGVMLMQLIAYVGDGLAWYQDFKASEAFIGTASLRKNVGRGAWNLGYKVGRAIAARAAVTIALTQTYTFDVVIPSGTACAGPNDLQFTLNDDVKFYTGELVLRPVEAVKATVTEGQVIRMAFISDESSNQKFPLSDHPAEKFVAQGTMLVTVDGVHWMEQDYWTFDGTNHCIVDYNDSPPTLKFGDGVSAPIPRDGAQIEVSWRACSGALGNAKSASITSFKSPVYVKGTEIRATLNNVLGASGGADEEDTRHVKVYAPRIFLTKDRAVTIGDYETLAMNYVDVEGSLARARGVVVKQVLDDAYLQGLLNLITDAGTKAALTNYLTGIIASGRDVNLIKLYVLSLDGSGTYVDPSTNFMNRLSDYLETKKVATVVVQIVAGSTLLRLVNITIQIGVLDNYNAGDVISAVNAAVQELLKNRNFGIALRASHVYEAAQEVAGVDYVRVTLSLPVGSTGVKMDSGDAIPDPQYILVAGTVSITGTIRPRNTQPPRDIRATY
jgi:hypothetical protein